MNEKDEQSGVIYCKLQEVATVVLRCIDQPAPRRNNRKELRNIAFKLAARPITLQELEKIRAAANDGRLDLIKWKALKQPLYTIPSPEIKPEICAAVLAAGVDGVTIEGGKIRFASGRFCCWVGSNLFAYIAKLRRLTPSSLLPPPSSRQPSGGD